MSSDRVPTGVPGLDQILGGGLEPDGLTEFYGEGGTGKTVACLQATVHVAERPAWVAYVDTEGVSVARLEAITGDRRDEVLEHLLLATPKDLTQQTRAVRSASLLARSDARPVGLIVLDSATLYYRLAVGEDNDETGRAELARQLATLLATSLERAIPVIFTNQVWRNVQDGRLEPLGGTFVNHVAKTIVRFDRLEGARRRVTLMKHRSLPGASAEFEITSSGVR